MQHVSTIFHKFPNLCLQIPCENSFSWIVSLSNKLNSPEEEDSEHEAVCVCTSVVPEVKA